MSTVEATVAPHLVSVSVSQSSFRFPTTRPLQPSHHSTPTLSSRRLVAGTSSHGGRFCLSSLVHCSFSSSFCFSGVAVRVKREPRRRSSSSAILRSKVSGASCGVIHLPLGGLVAGLPLSLVVRKTWNACRTPKTGRATARVQTVARPSVFQRASREAAGSPWVSTRNVVARLRDART